MKTFQQLKTDQEYSYPGFVPQSLRSVINDWFDTREVVDDTNFGRYFDRILHRDYHRYNEILRIEAGAGVDGDTAGFDWLVNAYMERQVKLQGSTTNTGTITKGKTGNDVVTYAPGVKVTETTADDITFGKQSKTDYGKATDTDFGKVTETDYGHTIETELGTSTETTYGRKDEYSEDHDITTGNGTSANATTTSKATPASVLGTYSDGTQTNANRTTGQTLGQTTCWDNELSAPTAISKAVNNGYSEGYTDTDIQGSNEASGKDTVENSGVDTVTNDGIDTVTNRGTDTVTNSGSDTTKLSGTDQRDIEKTIEKEGSDETTTEYGSTDTQTNNLATGEESTRREISSGRMGENMADALTKARNYIVTTSAWDFLQKQLEPCFMAVYDV